MAVKEQRVNKVSQLILYITVCMFDVLLFVLCKLDVGLAIEKEKVCAGMFLFQPILIHVFCLASATCSHCGR